MGTDGARRPRTARVRRRPVDRRSGRCSRNLQGSSTSYVCSTSAVASWMGGEQGAGREDVLHRPQHEDDALEPAACSGTAAAAAAAAATTSCSGYANGTGHGTGGRGCWPADPGRSVWRQVPGGGACRRTSRTGVCRPDPGSTCAGGTAGGTTGGAAAGGSTTGGRVTTAASTTDGLAATPAADDDAAASGRSPPPSATDDGWAYGCRSADVSRASRASRCGDGPSRWDGCRDDGWQDDGRWFRQRLRRRIRWRFRVRHSFCRYTRVVAA